MTDPTLARTLRTRLQAARTPSEMVAVLTETTDLSPNQATALVQQCGSDLARLIEAAVRFKAEG